LKYSGAAEIKSEENQPRKIELRCGSVPAHVRPTPALCCGGHSPSSAFGKLPGLMPPSVSSLRSHRHVGNPGNFTTRPTLGCNKLARMKYESPRKEEHRNKKNGTQEKKTNRHRGGIK
jgi:hypothetical protein